MSGATGTPIPDGRLALELARPNLGAVKTRGAKVAAGCYKGKDPSRPHDRVPSD